MANPDRPNGFECFGSPMRATVAVAAGAIYPGDPVKQTSAGKVARATASEALRGVALSYAAADGDEVLLADHPDQLFKVQADSTHIAAQTDINRNYNIAATSAAFSATYKISRVQLASSTGDNDASTSSNLPLKLLAITKEANNAFGTKAKCVVRINNHQLADGKTGV